MEKKIIEKIILESSANLMLNLNDTEKELLINNFSLFENGVFNSIKNFDLDRYSQLLDESNVLHSQGRLRDDVIVKVNNPHTYFQNAIEFESDMVVVKNEK